MIQVRGVVPRGGDEQRALSEDVIRRPVEGRHDSPVVALVADVLAADVDHVGTLVGGIHEATGNRLADPTRERFQTFTAISVTFWLIPATTFPLLA